MLALTGSQKADYQRRAELLLHSLYPRTFGNIIFSHVEEPTLGGYALSNNTAKFASSLSLKTESSNLFHIQLEFLDSRHHPYLLEHESINNARSDPLSL